MKLERKSSIIHNQIFTLKFKSNNLLIASTAQFQIFTLFMEIFEQNFHL